MYIYLFSNLNTKGMIIVLELIFFFNWWLYCIEFLLKFSESEMWMSLSVEFYVVIDNLLYIGVIMIVD